MVPPPPNPTGSVYGSVPPPYTGSSPFPPPRPGRPRSTNTALIVVCILGSLGVAALLFAYGVVKGMGGIPLKSAGTVSSTPLGITYTNASQDIRVTAPPDWTAKPDKDTLFFFRNKEGCSVMMLEAIDVEALPESQQRLLDIIRKKNPDIQTSFTHEQIAHRDTVTLHVEYRSGQADIRQSYAKTRRGLHVFNLLETDRKDAPCADAFAQIESTMHW